MKNITRRVELSTIDTRKVVLGFSLILALFFAGILSIPGNAFTNAMGVQGLKIRLYSLSQAIYWQTRVIIHPDAPVEHKVFYGYVRSLGYNGKVEIDYPENEKFVTKNFMLADMKVTDYHSVNQFLTENRSSNLKIDAYGEMVVLHLSSDHPLQMFNPLNIYLIEKGFAEPDPNPPSNIVDKAFATHYWKNVFSKQL